MTENIEIHAGQMTLTLSSDQASALCPHCLMPSARIHGHYTRRPADLSCAGHDVRLAWQVRRFFCDNDQCAHRTFAQRFPGVLEPFARRTQRLVVMQQQMAAQPGWV